MKSLWRHQHFKQSGAAQDDNAMTWEPTANLSEDLVRDFEEAFWQACRLGDMEFLTDALKYGGETLANLLNSEGRGPLHLAAALNHQVAVQSLLEAGMCPHTPVWCQLSYLEASEQCGVVQRSYGP